MRLTDNERRDAIKYIQEGKPLHEKYRFLLFSDEREVELVWNGKTQDVCNLVLPFQTIEHIDEPRSERIKKGGKQLELFDTSGRQISGWTNKLIWGDNKLILSSLKNGPMRREIEKQGGLKLIYIDPPFDVGADFSMNVEIGEESFTKKPSVIEEVAYRDTWGKGADSFIAMIYERLKLMHGLLADDGSIYVHCDWRVNSFMRVVLDEVFGENNFVNEIVWQCTDPKNNVINTMGNIHQAIYYYAKDKERKIFNIVRTEHSQAANKEYSYYLQKNQIIDNGRIVEAEKNIRDKEIRFKLENTTAPKYTSNRRFEWHGYMPKNGWRYDKKTMDELLAKGLILLKDGKAISRCHVKYLDDMAGIPLQSIWQDTGTMKGGQGLYPTEKPEGLLERIVKASSNKGDLVADFFCGSGTTLAVAEKLGRKWIGSDLGRFAIHTSRKRLIQVQREMKQAGKDFRAFVILNLGKYEREQYVNVDIDLREQEKQKVLERKEKQYVELILSAYKAQPVDSYNNFVGKKRDRLVAVGPISTPVSSKFVDEAIKEAKTKGVTKFDVLGFDYEMGIDFSELSRHGVDVQFKVIPREVFDRRAVEKGHVKFYDVAYIEVKPIVTIQQKNQLLKAVVKIKLLLSNYATLVFFIIKIALKKQRTLSRMDQVKLLLKMVKLLRFLKIKKLLL